jgi:hypothetical protein
MPVETYLRARYEAFRGLRGAQALASAATWGAALEADVADELGLAEHLERFGSNPIAVYLFVRDLRRERAIGEAA